MAATQSVRGAFPAPELDLPVSTVTSAVPRDQLPRFTDPLQATATVLSRLRHW